MQGEADPSPASTDFNEVKRMLVLLIVVLQVDGWGMFVWPAREFSETLMGGADVDEHTS